MSTDYRNYVIGGPDCGINELYIIMVGNDAVGILIDKIEFLASHLDIKPATQYFVRQFVKNNPSAPQTAIFELLQHFVSEKSYAATLGALLDALEKVTLIQTKNDIESHYSRSEEVEEPSEHKRLLNDRENEVVNNEQGEIPAEQMPPREPETFNSLEDPEATDSERSIDVLKPIDLNQIETAMDDHTGGDNESVLSETQKTLNDHDNEIGKRDQADQQMTPACSACRFIPFKKYSVAFAIICFVIIIIVTLAPSKSEKEANTVATIDEKTETDDPSWGHSIFNVSSFSEFEKISKNYRQCCSALNISIQNSTDWLVGQTLDGEYLLKNLTISGPLGVAVLLEILADAVNLTILHVDNTNGLFCKHNQHKNTSHIFKTVKLLYLHTMIFTKFDICANVYSILGSHIKKEMSHILIKNSELDDTNIANVRKLLEEAKLTLEYIELSFHSRTKQSVLHVIYKYPKVCKIKYEITRYSVDGKKLYPGLRENISDTFPNLEYFDSQLGITYIDLINLLKCKKLKDLNVTVYFTNEDETWDLASAYKGDMLANVEITLLFTSPCPDENNTWRYGISKFSDKVIDFKITSTCIVIKHMQESKHSGRSMYTFSRHQTF